MMRSTLLIKAVFVLIIQTWIYPCFSQNHIEKWISSPEDEIIESMTYLYSDILVLTVHRGETAETYQDFFTNYSNVIYKSDYNLEFSDSLFLDEIGDYDVLVKQFLKVDAFGILFWAKAMNKYTQDEQLSLIWFDEDLNLVNSSILGSPDTTERISDAIVCSDGNLLFVGSVQIDATDEHYLLWELDESTNEIKKIVFEEIVYSLPSVVEIKGTNKFHLCTGFKTFQFDDDLNFEMLYNFPSNINIHPQSQNQEFNDFEYIKTCLFLSAPIPGSPWEMDLAFSVMDENANVTNTYTFGIPDSTDTPGKLHFITTDTIYIAGTRNFSNNPVQDSWVSLFTTNLQGEILEHQFWGGGGQYQFSDIISFPNSGYLLATTRWDFLNLPEERTRDIRLITENFGNPVTSTTELTSQENCIRLFPNPGSNVIHIESCKKGFSFRMLDMYSRVVQNVDMDNMEKIIPTNKLPAGLYLYQIIDGKEVIQAGKWVKQ